MKFDDDNIDYKHINRIAGPVISVVGMVAAILGWAMTKSEERETEKRLIAIEQKVGIDYEND